MNSGCEQGKLQCSLRNLKIRGHFFFASSITISLLLGAFAKLRKAIIRHVRPSVRMQQLGSNWTDFHEI
jgi:hypothetical protein